MQYLEAKPSAGLRRLIKCFWSLEQSAAETPGSREPVLPDGCPEIVFNFADKFRRFHSDTEFELQPRVLFAGQMTRSIVIGPGGDVRLFGVRFQPTGAFAFLGMPLSELTDRIEDIFDLSRHCIMEVQLHEAVGFEERIAIFEAAMHSALSSNEKVDPKLVKAAEYFAACGDGRTVAELAEYIGWSERKLERDFKKYIGLSPKTYSRIVRFSAVVRALETTGPSELIGHAHRFGYYDQSHMINDFRSFAGESPTAFYGRSHRLSELFTVGD